MEKRNRNLVVSVFIIGILCVGVLYIFLPQGVPEDVELFDNNWTLDVFMTSGADVPEDYNCVLQLYQDESALPLMLAEDGIDGAVRLRNETMERLRGNSEQGAKYVTHSGLSEFFSIADNFATWHFRIMIANGTVDCENPENNLWNGTMHLNQYQNQNTWRHYEKHGAFETYGFQFSYGDFTMRLRFLVK